MRPFKVNVYASDFEEAELAAGRKPPSVLAAEAAAAAKAAKKNGTSSGSNTSGNAMPLSFGSSGSGVGGGGNNGMGPTDNASPGSKMTKVARGGGRILVFIQEGASTQVGSRCFLSFAFTFG